MSDLPQDKHLKPLKNRFPSTTDETTPLNLASRSADKKKAKNEELKDHDNLVPHREDSHPSDRPSVQIKKRKEYSKYDFIKVRVTLGEHFYVLSRFLVSRMLTLCKIPHLDAVKISKDLKKHLVEANKLEIPQEEVNDILFEFMRIYNYGEQYINRYKMISKFYQKRTPMIILISGTVGIAKSIIATHLAERMNISNVLQTDIIESVMTKMYPELFDENIKTANYESKEEIIQRYEKRCKLVRRGANTDMHKGLVEGKPLIVEGFTLDPSLYVQKVNGDQESQKEDAHWDSQKLEELEKILKEADTGKTKENRLIEFNGNNHLKQKLRIIAYQDPDMPTTNEREKALQKELAKVDQKSAVIVPILLVLNKKDHVYCVENKIDSLKVFDGLTYQEKKAKVATCLDNYQAIQDHLLKKASLCTVVPISINNLEETLELLQDIIIEKIEADYENWSS